MAGPLHGVRVVELGVWVAGPSAGAVLADWGARGSTHAEPMRHAACGTPVEARLWCPTCARDIEAPDAEGLRFL